MHDSIFTIYRHEILFSNFNEPIYLIPFGDVHRYAPGCHEEFWLDFLDWAKTKKNCYFLGMGDYDDMLSSSERHAIHTAKLHESTMTSLFDLYRKRTEDFYNEIKFMKGKLIGLVEGNHHAVMQSNITTTQMLCEYLNCRYLGVCALIRLVFKHTKSNKSMSIDIFVHHGKGASRLHGSSINTVQQMAEVAEADIYLQGHDHKKSISLLSRLGLSEGCGTMRLKNRKILLGRTGSFLKGYEPFKPNYVTKKLLTPTDLGVIKIELTPRRIRSHERTDKEIDALNVDIHGSI